MKGTRNIELPLYLWINEFGSIFNVQATSKLGFNYIRKDIFKEVLTRYLRLYKTPCYRVDDVLFKMHKRYGTTAIFINEIRLDFMPCIGLAFSDEYGASATVCQKAATYAREKFRNLKRIKKKAQEEMDIFYFSLELKGIKSR